MKNRKRRKVPADTSFRDYVVEDLLSTLDVESHRMFGGYGLYIGGDFFGFIFSGRLYFKTSSQTREKYLAAGSRPFQPDPETVFKNIHEVPASVLEDSETLCRWAVEAAALSR